MGSRIDDDEDDALSDTGSNTSFGSHSSDLSDCECEDCLENFMQTHIWSPVVPYREGDIAKIRVNVFAFMMEGRRRNCFLLLALPVEVRFLILRELLYHDTPLYFDTDWDGSCRNFTFHPEILATCHQLQKEGSAILMHQNLFSMELYGNKYHMDSMEWMGFMSNPNINPRMESWEHSESIKKLRVNFMFEDYDANLPHMEAAAGHRLLVYDLVDKILSRAKRLSSLSVHCLPLYNDTAPFDIYPLEGKTGEQVGDDEPWTVEQYILEPLANLKGGAHQFSFLRMIAGCKEFLKRCMESIEQFQCDQQLRIDMMRNRVCIIHQTSTMLTVDWSLRSCAGKAAMLQKGERSRKGGRKAVEETGIDELYVIITP